MSSRALDGFREVIDAVPDRDGAVLEVSYDEVSRGPVLRMAEARWEPDEAACERLSRAWNEVLTMCEQARTQGDGQ